MRILRFSYLALAVSSAVFFSSPAVSA
ncbi:MAG: hypothetical protein RLZZ15_3034, partial [Verrucomicrobiota bacterium]